MGLLFKIPPGNGHHPVFGPGEHSIRLKMKFQNMPVPLTAKMVDEYMGPILEAARDGDLSRIRNVTA